MRSLFAALPAIVLATAASAGDAQVDAAQSTIAGQIEAFKAGDNAKAYSYAAPNIQRIYPSVDAFMGMVKGAYQPVWRPRSYTFGKSQAMGDASIIQQVLVVGPDGKNYEAVYTLQRGDDGVYRITGVSLKASNALSA